MVTSINRAFSVGYLDLAEFTVLYVSFVCTCETWPPTGRENAGDSNGTENAHNVIDDNNLW